MYNFPTLIKMRALTLSMLECKKTEPEKEVSMKLQNF